jgi:hypothetical protein
MSANAMKISLPLFASLFLSGLATADGLNPGSLLLFPEFDHSSGQNTLLTVTNTNRDAITGAIRVHFKYVSGVPGSTLCTEADRIEFLTPGDTLTVLTSAHNPGPFNRGFVYVYAVNVATQAVSFDFLAGDALQIDSGKALQHSLSPLNLRAVPAQGLGTDLDGDGLRDLNGLEYEGAPAKVLIPRFMGQDAGYQSELVLIGLSGGSQFTTLLDFLMFNDNEEVFSGQYSFRCWQKAPLSSISAMFDNTFLRDGTTQASGEIIGATARESGWISINGHTASSMLATIQDPAFLAVLVERGGGGNNQGAEMPFFQGIQLNGDLVPQSIFGDQN